jgi:hypothetical protein
VFRFLLGECLPEKVAEALGTWNAANPGQSIDFISVGGPPNLPKGTGDPDILSLGGTERPARGHGGLQIDAGSLG